MRTLFKTITGAALAVGLGFGAQAAPVTVDPGVVVGLGNVSAVFAFQAASDVSELREVNFSGTIFNNQLDAVGTTRNLGENNGVLTFVLSNLSQGYQFQTGSPDPVDGFYHAVYSTDFTSFGVGALPGAAAAAIAALGTPVLYVAFEDQRNGDYDYNDLIFAITPARVPEPASMALFGAGLLGLGLVRRRRRS